MTILYIFFLLSVNLISCLFHFELNRKTCQKSFTDVKNYNRRHLDTGPKGDVSLMWRKKKKRANGELRKDKKKACSLTDEKQADEEIC